MLGLAFVGLGGFALAFDFGLAFGAGFGGFFAALGRAALGSKPGGKTETEMGRGGLAASSCEFGCGGEKNRKD